MDWEVVDFESGHMPFESQPEKLAHEIVRLTTDFLDV